MVGHIKKVFLFVLFGFVISLTFQNSLISRVEAQENRAWLEMTSDNFKVYSMLNEKKTSELVRQLELFRVLVLMVTNVKTDTSATPTEIYILRGRSEMTKIGISNKFSGLFRRGLRKNIIIVQANDITSGKHIIQHEYVHYLMHNRSSINYPMWYSEGFAEYLGATKMQRGKLRLGAALHTRQQEFTHLDWIPIKRILDPDAFDFWSGELRAMFYAQSWAMVHYLLSDPVHKSRFRKDMFNYLTFRKQGVDPIESFEKAFELDVDEFALKIKRYVKVNRYSAFSFDPDKLLPVFSPVVTKMERPEAALKLANLALEFGKIQEAENWFKIASEEESLRAYAEAGLGSILSIQNKFEEALPHFETAINIIPDDPTIQLDAGKHWENLAKEKSNKDYLLKAKRHYETAWNLDKTSPEALFSYGRIFLREGETVNKGIEMLEQAQASLGGFPPVLLSLLDAYMHVGRREQAAQTARTILAATHIDSDASKKARDVLARIEGAPLEGAP